MNIVTNPREEIFRTLADPIRRAMSKHLALLKRAGLVRDRHEGRRTHHSVEYAAPAPLVDGTHEMVGFREKTFNAVDDLLNRMDP